MNMNSEDFYIGYLPKMPKSTAKFVRAFVALAFASAVGTAIVLWVGQKPFAKSVFEFGTMKEFEGTIQAGAVPFLLIEKPERNNGLPAFERIPLVGEGKHAFNAEGFDNRRVKLKGTLIYRDNVRMIEVSGKAVETISESLFPVEAAPESLGRLSLKGEIVDSKCYLGVMNPGASKPHRDCAALCLRGGIPPLFIVKDLGGNLSELWLVSPEGKSVNREILDYVAEPLEISGEVFRLGDQLFFKIDPREIKRL